MANEAFLNRYVSGYEFFPVPDLRNSEAEWQRFLISLCQSILDAVNAGKRTTNNLVHCLANSLRELGEEPELMDAPGLLLGISNHWKKISAQVRNFHEGSAGLGLVGKSR